MLHHFENSLAASYKVKQTYHKSSDLTPRYLLQKKRKRMSNGVLVNVYQPALRGKKALICSNCQLWCKYSHHGLFQTVY